MVNVTERLLDSGVVDDVECARVYAGYARVECDCQRSRFSCCVLGCIHCLMRNQELCSLDVALIARDLKSSITVKLRLSKPLTANV